MMIDEKNPWATLEASKFHVALLTDPYCRKILAYTVSTKASAQDISSKLDIPIAVCYRRLKDLEKVGLITVVERYLNRKGKRVNIYKAMVKVARIEFSEGKWFAEVEMLGGPQYRWDGEEMYPPTHESNIS